MCSVSTPMGNLAHKLLDKEGGKEGSLTLWPISLSAQSFFFLKQKFIRKNSESQGDDSVHVGQA